jgi:hypothetical protein
VGGVSTLEAANRYLEQQFLPWWNQNLTVMPASADDAHRRLGPQHNLAAILSWVAPRKITNDYTVRWKSKLYQIHRRHIVQGMRGAAVRIEHRLDGSLALAYRGQYLEFAECAVPDRHAVPRSAPRSAEPATPRNPAERTAAWRKFNLSDSPPLRQLYRSGALNRT